LTAGATDAITALRRQRVDHPAAPRHSQASTC
jgi:hypothetical protein